MLEGHRRILVVEDDAEAAGQLVEELTPSGYQVDLARSIWPYREWVINAFNRNMPFDQFTVEQLAGDLIPNATLEQRIATGFNRNTKINDEGGGDEEEYRTKATRPRYSVLSKEKFRRTFGLDIPVWQDGLRRFFEVLSEEV